MAHEHEPHSPPTSPRATGPAGAALAAALGAYLGELLAGKRVAILGDGSSALAEQVAAAAGRRAHVFDPDARRTAEAIARSRGGDGRVRYALLEGDAEISAGAFDVVIIPDLAELAASGAVDAVGAIDLAEQMLGPRGFAAIAAPNGGDELGYYRLYDLAAARFREVQMLGAAPFVGFTVAAFGGDDEPAVAIDSSLTEKAEEPLGFVAIASRQPLAIDAYLLVQLPSHEGLTALGQKAEAPVRVDPRADSRLEEAQARERQARELADARAKSLTAVSARLSELEGALERQRGDRRREQSDIAAERERERDEYQRELDAILERVAELETQLEAAKSSSEARAAVADTHKAPAASEANEAAQQHVQGLDFQIAELKRLLGEARSECDGLRPEAARAKAALAELERQKKLLEVASAAAEKTHDEATSAETAADLVALEAQLKERGQRVAQLESELREGERFGRELVRELEDARRAVTGGDNGESAAAGSGEAEAVGGQLAALASKCAGYQADLQSASWKIEALERQLGEDAGGEGYRAADTAKLEAALRAAHDEIAKLRHAVR